MEDERTTPNETEEEATGTVEATDGGSYAGPDPEADPKGDESDEDQGT